MGMMIIMMYDDSDDEDEPAAVHLQLSDKQGENHHEYDGIDDDDNHDYEPAVTL